MFDSFDKLAEFCKEEGFHEMASRFQKRNQQMIESSYINNSSNFEKVYQRVSNEAQDFLDNINQKETNDRPTT